MTQPSGWYDDPQVPNQLRYWDGVIWSNHVTPKVSPSAEQSTIGMPYGVTPAAARPQAPGSQGAQGSPFGPSGFEPPGQGQPSQWQQDQDQSQWQQDQGQWQQGGQGPAYGQQHPGQLGQPPQGWASSWPTTPDGVVLSGWWKRVLANILDNIIIFFVALPLTFVPLRRAFGILGDIFQQGLAAGPAGTGGSNASALAQADLDVALLQVSLILLAFYLVYEVASLTMTGATIGRRAVGISVRLRDKPGPPPLLAVLKRTAVKEGPSLVQSSGLIGIFAGLFSLIDRLWPLWDDKKQALHDKAGATNVVVGQQPKRGA